jgi:hypothetical protein
MFQRSPIARAALLSLGALLLAPLANAARFDLGNGIEGSFDSTISISTQIRAGSADCRYLGYDNGGCPSGSGRPGESSLIDQAALVNYDDGDLNYSKRHSFSTTLRGVHDLYVSGPDDWKLLVRGAWFHDFAAADTQRTALDSGARSTAVSDAEILDAYVDKGFDLGGHSANLRVGKQVINWGEALLTLGGINEANPIDIRKAQAAGVQLKELYIARPMVSWSSSVTDNFGVQAFYEFGFKPDTLPAAGTYFSTLDFAGAGGHTIYLGSPALALATGTPLSSIPPGTLGDAGTVNAIYGTRLSDGAYADPVNGPLALASGGLIPTGSIVRRGADIEPNNGQFGLSGRYTLESGDELGLYYMRYHEKFPVLSYRVGATTDNPLGLASYDLEYPADRQLFGASYNLKVGEWSWGLEGAYRPKQVLMIDPTVMIGAGGPYDCSTLASGQICHGYIETKKWQFTASGMQILKPSSFGGLLGMLGISEGTLLAEVASAYYPGLDRSQLATPIASAPLSKTRVPYAWNLDYDAPTKTSGGIALDGQVTFSNIFGTRAALAPEIAISHGLWGTAGQAGPGFTRNQGQATYALNFDFRTANSLKARIDYTQFYGGGDNNPMQDRDYFSVALTSSF